MVNFRVHDHTEQTLLPQKFLSINQAVNHRKDMHDMSELSGEKKHDIKIQGFSGKFFVREYSDDHIKDIAEKLSNETYCRCANPKVNQTIHNGDWCNICENKILV